MASWYGTDIFMEKFSEKRQDIGGYFSYVTGDRAICLFFSNSTPLKTLATFSFDSTYNVNTAAVDAHERPLSEKEMDLLAIRQIALNELRTDTLFKFYEDMSPNLIPLNDEKGKRVYILTGPKKQGVVVFGNDYLLTFAADNTLKEKKTLHKNIIRIGYGREDGKQIIATMHTHLPETGDIVTATDVCTLMLYGKYAKWGQHYVMSKKNVSIWDCDKDRLIVMTRDAWDKIYSNKKD
jgi:hypothetical protein